MLFPNCVLRCGQVLIASALFLNTLNAKDSSVPFESTIQDLRKDQTPEEFAESLRSLHKSMKEQGFEVLPLVQHAMFVREELSYQYGIEITTEEFEYICDLLRDQPNIPIEKVSHHKSKGKKKKGNEIKMPARVVGGFLKILAGSLLFIVPFPITNIAGGVLVGAGLCDLVDGCVDEEKKREGYP